MSKCKSKVAQINDYIRWKLRDTEIELEGVVEKVYQNSVIVNLTVMPNFPSLIELGLEDRTVVSHKRYTIVS